MPTFELEEAGPERLSGVVRARDAADAIRRASRIPESADVVIGEPEGAGLWQSVKVDGAPAGRVRTHQRMRFRRD